jgi:hypothetical protein
VPASKRQALRSKLASKRPLFEQDFVGEAAEFKNNVQLTPSDNTDRFLHSFTRAKRQKHTTAGIR